MKEYIIVNVKHFPELEKAVNEMMKLGYTPIGNPYIAPDQQLSQAMILTNRKDPEQPGTKVAKAKQPKEK
jgi:hypothetical protein